MRSFNTLKAVGFPCTFWFTMQMNPVTVCASIGKVHKVYNHTHFCVDGGGRSGGEGGTCAGRSGGRVIVL